MPKKSTSTKTPKATFEVRFNGPDLEPESIPIGTVYAVISALQDIASGRDPAETPHVPSEKAVGLVDVRRGSAIYRCFSHAPVEALQNLSRVGAILSDTTIEGSDAYGEELVAALGPIQKLSEVAKAVNCQLEVRSAMNGRSPLFAVGKDDYQRISKRLLLKGEATVIGNVQRVGGATGIRCLLRVPGRRRILYCDVSSRELVQRLGQHLYENIVASGTAVWIHRSWRIYQFTIKDFTQPELGNPAEAISELRNAGLSAWDSVRDPEALIGELRK